MGWPTLNTMKNARIVSVYIIEPNAQSNESGDIFVWVFPDKKNVPFYEYFPNKSPRAYRIEYTEKSKKAFEKIKKMIEEGYYVEVGGDEEGNGDGSGKSSSNNSKDGKKGTGMSGDSALLFEYELDKPMIRALDPRTIISKD